MSVIENNYTSPAVPLRVVSGKWLGMAQIEPGERGLIGAEWRDNRIQIAPTWKQAALVVGVSVPTIMAAAATLKPVAAGDAPDRMQAMFDAIWLGMSQSARDSAISRHIHSVWQTVENVTIGKQATKQPAVRWRRFHLGQRT